MVQRAFMTNTREHKVKAVMRSTKTKVEKTKKSPISDRKLEIQSSEGGQRNPSKIPSEISGNEGEALMVSCLPADNLTVLICLSSCRVRWIKKSRTSGRSCT